MTEREAWLATVQREDAPADTETELVTIERGGEGQPPVIELTDGTRITCIEPANARETQAA